MEDNTKEQVLQKNKSSKKKAAIISVAVILCVLVAVAVGIFVMQKHLSDRSYEIQFYAGEQLVETVTLSGSGIVTVPEAPEKPGYTFEGWFLDNDSWQKPFKEDHFAQDKIKQNVKVYAKYVGNKYTLSFVVKEETVATLEVISGEKIGQLPNVPAKTNYTPAGWTIEGVLIDENTVWTYTEDKIAEPKYKGEEYTLTLVDEEGNKQQVTVEYGKKLPNLPQPPSKEGYQGYWSIDGTILLENSRWWYTEDKTAHAVYVVAPIYYSAKIYLKDSPGGEYVDRTVDYLDYVGELAGEDGKSVNIIDIVKALWPDGYQINLRASQLAGIVSQENPLVLNVYFDKITREDTGNQLPGDSFEFGIAGDIYVLTFDAKVGTFTPVNVVCGSLVGKLPQVPAKSGYTGAWVVDGQVITENTIWSIGANKTATVAYTPNPYHLSFEGVDTDIAVTYGHAISNLPAVPEKMGYTGVWEINGVTLTDGMVWSYGEDMTATAVYSPLSYKLSFTGASSDVESMTVVFGEELSNLPAAPQKQGYTAVWMVDGQILVEGSVWNFASDKVATVSYIRNNELPGDPLDN